MVMREIEIAAVIVVFLLMFGLGMFFTHISLVALELLWEAAGFSIYTITMFSLIVFMLFGIYSFFIIYLKEKIGWKKAIAIGVAPILLYLTGILIT